MGQAYTDRMRFKHFLRNTVNQDMPVDDLQDGVMKLLQSMEKSDHIQRQVFRKVVEQNKMAAMSVTKWELGK